jgi:hypothetical protein
MKKFHSDVDKRARRNGGAVASLQMLFHQLPVYCELFKDLATATSTMVANQAKEINREFQPVIMEAVRPAYTQCVDERGMTSLRVILS